MPQRMRYDCIGLFSLVTEACPPHPVLPPFQWVPIKMGENRYVTCLKVIEREALSTGKGTYRTVLSILQGH